MLRASMSMVLTANQTQVVYRPTLQVYRPTLQGVRRARRLAALELNRQALQGPAPASASLAPIAHGSTRFRLGRAWTGIARPSAMRRFPGA